MSKPPKSTMPIPVSLGVTISAAPVPVFPFRIVGALAIGKVHENGEFDTVSYTMMELKGGVSLPQKRS